MAARPRRPFIREIEGPSHSGVGVIGRGRIGSWSLSSTGKSGEEEQSRDEKQANSCRPGAHQPRANRPFPTASTGGPSLFCATLLQGVPQISFTWVPILARS
jgi:hypothetical protein